MKIAIPVDQPSMDTAICASFGRAPSFLIYDTKTNESVFLNNNSVDSQGGAGIKAAQAVADSGANALLTPRCGGNAAQVLKAADITLYQVINDSVSDNIKAFQEGKLAPLSDIHPGFHGRGK